MTLELSSVLLKGEAEAPGGRRRTEGHTRIVPHETKIPHKQNLKSCSASLATFAFHFLAIIQEMNQLEPLEQSDRSLPVTLGTPPLHSQSTHILMARGNGTDLSPMAVSYLLRGRAAAPHWPGWTSTS